MWHCMMVRWYEDKWAWTSSLWERFNLAQVLDSHASSDDSDTSHWTTTHMCFDRTHQMMLVAFGWSRDVFKRVEKIVLPQSHLSFWRWKDTPKSLIFSSLFKSFFKCCHDSCLLCSYKKAYAQCDQMHVCYGWILQCRVCAKCIGCGYRVTCKVHWLWLVTCMILCENSIEPLTVSKAVLLQHSTFGRCTFDGMDRIIGWEGNLGVQAKVMGGHATSCDM